MARVNFTAGRIANFVCPHGKQQDFLWDKDAPGLALRATENGAKAFVFQAKVGGPHRSPHAWATRKPGAWRRPASKPAAYKYWWTGA